MQAFFASFSSGKATVVPLYAPSREKGTPERPQTLRCTEKTNHFSAENAQQRRRPPPVAETGRSCWGSGQQDARAVQGTMRMLGAATRKKRRGIPNRSAQQKSRRTKSAAALRGVTSQPALCDDPPHTGQVDPTQQMLQYDQHGILLSDRPFQPNSPFSKNRSSLVKLPPPKRLSSGPRP